MMNSEEYTGIMHKKSKILDSKRKQDAKIKSISKEQERRERAPSCRLGKTVKKLAARIAKILETEKEEVEEIIVEKSTIGVKPMRVKLTRMKRKPSHRDRLSFDN